MTLVDLHLHTTASDGRCTPVELVGLAAGAGVSILAVTDHDTTAAVPEAQALALERGIEAVSGIEITAVDDGRDLHVLGYFFDPADAALTRFLDAQREARLARVVAIGDRLAELGVQVDLQPLVERARLETGRRSIGRPHVARAMVEGGRVASVREAFDRWLGRGRPAFVPRSGASAESVIRILHDAGGLVSLAHPGKEGLAPRLPSLADAGLDAVEAFHPDHDDALVEEYVRLARDLRLALTGGSDFHGDPAHDRQPGSVALPWVEWIRLQEARDRRHPRPA